MVYQGVISSLVCIALAPLLCLSRLIRKAVLWGVWLILVAAALAALSTGVVLCVGGYVLSGLIIISVTLVIEWGLL